MGITKWWDFAVPGIIQSIVRTSGIRLANTLNSDRHGERGSEESEEGRPRHLETIGYCRSLLLHGRQD